MDFSHGDNVGKAREIMVVLLARFILSGVLLVWACAFLLVLVAGRFLFLWVDEFYFLNGAYAIANQWPEALVGLSRPYELYERLLALFITPGQPKSLSRVVIVDSIMQVTCMSTLAYFCTVRAGRLHEKFLVIVSVLFFFSIGRLSEHRPDYWAVTSLTLGFLALIPLLAMSKASAQRWHWWPVLAAPLFVFAIAMSPRSAVLLLFSAPPIAVLSVFVLGPIKTFFALIISGISALIAMIIILITFDFSVYSMILTVSSDEFDYRAGLSLYERFRPSVRFSLALPTLVTIFVGAAVFFTTTNQQARGFAVMAAAVGAAQLGLIIYDENIFAYGYSYGLVGVVLGILALSKAKSTGAPKAVYWACIALLTVVWCYPAYKIYQGKGYHYVREIDWGQAIALDDGPGELAKYMVGGSFFDRLESRIKLCSDYPKAQVISSFSYSPICLRSAYSDLADDLKRNSFFGDLSRFPSRGAEMSDILTHLGISIEANGILILKPDEPWTGENIVVF